MDILLKLSGSPAALAAFLTSVPSDLLASTDTTQISATPGLPPVTPPPLFGGLPATPALDDDEGPVAATAPGELDANGYPWDERIHAKTKGKNGDGTWRLKRGVAEATVLAVQAELRNRAAPLMPVPMTAAPMPPAVPPAMPEMAPVSLPPVAMMPPVAPVTPPPVAPVTPPPPAPAAPAANDFAGFMAHLTGKMAAQEITLDYLNNKVQTFNAAWAAQPGFVPINAVTDLQANPAGLQYMIQLIQMDSKW